MSNIKRGGKINCSGAAHEITKREVSGRRVGNTVGKKFGHWTVLEELGGGKIRVQCDCEARTTAIRYKKAILNGESKSCGCAAVPYKTDLIGKKFGHWTVIGSAGNGMCLCECDCQNHTRSEVSRANLINGISQSCGCEQGNRMKRTMLERYSEVASRKIENPREQWQIETLHDADKLRDIILDLGYKPDVKDLCRLLKVNESTVLVNIHKFNLESLVEIQPSRSEYEKQLEAIIRNIDPNINLLTNDRTVLSGLELDFYMPDLSLAIEFDGTFWHCSDQKSVEYHQNKSLRCNQKNIHLIHIFEYEWLKQDVRNKIINYLTTLISKNKKPVHARNTIIQPIESSMCDEFLDKYHMQGSSNASIRYGMFYESTLIAVMTFSTPRFHNSKNYDYELIRYCTSPDVAISGGAEKLLHRFISDYSPNSILTYCDLTKFNGAVYTRIGFKPCRDFLTQPGYVWVKPNTNEVLARYQTTKKNLIKSNICTESDTEDSVMKRLGFLKVYNSGNLKYEYIKD